MSDTHIAPADQEKLDQFQVITAFKDEDYDKVVSLLRNNSWNLEVALSKYFDGQLDQEAARQPPSQTENENSSQTPINEIPFTNPFNDDQWTNFEPPLTQQIQFTNSVFLPQLPIVRPISNKWRSHPGLPKNDEKAVKGTNTSSSKFSSGSLILFLLLLIPRTLTLILSSIGRFINWLFPPPADYIPKEPSVLSFDFNNHFEELTQDKSSIQFFEGEFNDAFNIVKLENKFLLLILVGNNENSNTFIKQVLNNNGISELIKEEDITVFAGNVNEPQSFEIAKTIKTRSVPSAYLIANVSNGQNGIASMSVLSRIPTKSAPSFLSKVRREVEHFKPEIITRRAEQDELNYARQVRDLQDRAFEESLIADKLKQERKALEKKELQDKEERQIFNQINRLRYLASYYKKFELQKDFFDNLKKGEYSTIRVKLPSGEGITQRFSSKHTLLDIYSFVDLKIYLKNIDEEDLGKLRELVDEEVHIDFKNVFKFELISPFPRYNVPVDEKILIKDTNQLWPNGSLFTEFNDADEESDDDE